MRTRGPGASLGHDARPVARQQATVLCYIRVVTILVQPADRGEPVRGPVGQQYCIVHAENDTRPAQRERPGTDVAEYTIAVDASDHTRSGRAVVEQQDAVS